MNNHSTRKLTLIQRTAFEASIQYETVSSRGNTKPRYIIDMIKHKRRLENEIRKLASTQGKGKRLHTPNYSH